MKKIILITTCGLFLLCGLAIYLFKWEAIGWYFWHNHQDKKSVSETSLDLGNYQVEIDGMPVPQLTNASGFTYNKESNTLFTVLNKESLIIEMSIHGELLRSIHVVGVQDMEGITHISGQRYVIADERDNRLILVTLDANINQIDINHSPKLKLAINPNGNKNFEGISWDETNQRLLVVKERDPKFIMAINGFVDADVNKPLNIEINKIESFDGAIKWSLRDLSSVTYHSKTSHFLLLSDESRLVKEYDEQGKAMGALALWKGFHGLHKNVPQAEGIAVGTDGRIYIMSEPNLFYVFKPNSENKRLQAKLTN
jgi:uncharacterized protein YjiK